MSSKDAVLKAWSNRHPFKKNPGNKTAIVLLSGGADSTTILMQAMAECRDVYAISIFYGQRHKRELTAAKNICEECKIPHEIINFDALSTFSNSPLVDPDVNVPDQADGEQAKTVVPYRNTFLATIAAAYAHKVGANVIYMGPTWEDLANYPDCRPEFYRALQQTLRLSGPIHELEIRTPFIDMNKTEIIRIGARIGTPYELTWTCYNGQKRPCMKCDACIERMDSFYDNGLRDPIVVDGEWEKYCDDRAKRGLNVACDEEN